MKQIKDIHNQQCVKTNSMLSLYGFVEEREIVVRDGKKEDLRFLYLQLRPSVGLLVYNFYHTHIKGDLQGFDMFMYHSANVKDAIYQFHGHKRTKGLPEFNLLSIQNHLEYTELLINKFLEEDSNDYFALESKYKRLSQDLYHNKTNNETSVCK